MGTFPYTALHYATKNPHYHESNLENVLQLENISTRSNMLITLIDISITLPEGENTPTHGL